MERRSQSLIPYVGITFWILVSSVPLYMISRMVDALAGQDTTIEVTVGLSIGLGVCIGGVPSLGYYLTQRKTNQKRRDDLVRQRVYCRKLEHIIDSCVADGKILVVEARKEIETLTGGEL